MSGPRLRSRGRLLLSVAAYAVTVVALSGLVCHNDEEGIIAVNWGRNDFFPAVGQTRPVLPADWNLIQPAGPITWNDVSFFIPDIYLSQPAPSARSFTFEIKEDKWWSDPLLGAVVVRFEQGEVKASSFSYPATFGGAQAPQGTPPPDTTGFWLGCTQGGRVKGNAGRGDDGHARVYLVLAPGSVSDPGSPMWTTVGDGRSESHDVRCGASGGGSDVGQPRCPAARPFCCQPLPDGRCLECINPNIGQKCQ